MFQINAITANMNQSLWLNMVFKMLINYVNLGFMANSINLCYVRDCVRHIRGIVRAPVRRVKGGV